MISDEVKRACVLSWLDYVQGIKRTMDASGEMLERYRSMLDVTARAYDLPGVNPEDMPERIARLMELRERWEFDVETLSGEFDEARRIMARSPERMWMWDHYVNRRKWREIAKPAHYSVSAVRMASARHMAEIYDDLPEAFRRLPGAV